MNKYQTGTKGLFSLPSNKAYVVYVKVEKTNISRSGTKFVSKYYKRKCDAQKFADEYMFDHQVQTYITECLI